MKTGLSLQELAAELVRQQEAKNDYMVESKRIEMMPDAKAIVLNDEKDFGMTNLFHRQVGTTLGIPAKYYDKMQAEYPELLANNVNSWLGRNDSRRMVRTLDGNARAFLSDRYRRIDNYEIAMTALPIIGEMRDAHIESCQVTDNHLYLKVVNTRLTAEVKKGDIVQAGFAISNSEVGLGSVSVMPLVYRLVCLNGMIVNDAGQRKYHVGRENEESFELYSNETLLADDRAFQLKLQDIIRTSVDEQKFEKIISRLQKAMQLEITNNVPKFVELSAAEFGFNQNEQDNILQHLIKGDDLSLYGFAQAITRTSQDVKDYERATDLESMGWDVVNIPETTWKRITAA